MKRIWPAIACLVMLLIAVTVVGTGVVDAQTGWEYHRPITIDHTQVGADLTDFPIMIRLDGDWLRYQPSGDPGHVRQPDGGDIRFTTSSLVPLDHEIEVYDSAAGTLVVWVRIPSLSSSTDTHLYLWYGNTACENQWNPEAVWDDQFMMVHHLGETTGMHYDSTANAHDGTPLGGIVQDAAGLIDGADEFDGNDARIDFGTGRTGWSHQDVGYQRAVVKDGKIYVVGGGDHSLSSFHAYGFIFDLHTGELLLQSPSLGENSFTASETGPVLNGETAYLCPTKGNVSAWNTVTNSIEWTTTDLSIWSSRIEFDGTYLYATTTDYQVVKIDTSQQGLVTAFFDLDPDVDAENAVAPYLDEQEGAVYALGGSRLYKLSASNLSEVWNRDIGGGCLDSGSGHSRMVPIVVNDQNTGDEPWVIAGCWGNDTFYAYDAAGNLEWTRFITEGVRAIASYHPGNGYIYVPSQGDKIYALDVADGSVQFVVDSTDVPVGSGFTSPCTIVDNYLIFKTTSGTTQYLYLFDATTGDYVTRYTIGTNVFLSCFPIAVTEGYLITGGSLINYGGTDGGIFAIKAGDGQAVDYYPLHGPHRFGYLEGGLTDLGNDLNPEDQITIEAWANLDELTTDMNDHLLCRRDAYCLKFAQMPTDVPRIQFYDATNGWHNLDFTRTLTPSMWHHLVGTWDGVDIKLYIDGSLEATSGYTGTLNTPDNRTFIGSYDGNATLPGQSPDGRIDEVRLSSIARSPEWISATYNNQSAPSTFYAIGPEQQPGIEIAKRPDSQAVTSGSDVTFTISITNTGTMALTDLTVRDDLTPDCSRDLAQLGQGLSASYTCTAANVTTDLENLATVTGTVPGGVQVASADTAFVDVLPGFSLSKTAEPAEIMEPGGSVTFTIVVTNTCAEAIELTSLVDSVHGDLDGQGDCLLPQNLDPGEEYVCAFTATVSGPAGYIETDEVSAGCVDDEGNLVEAGDDATVTIKPAADILVIPTSLTVTEPDGQDSFNISLTTQPNASVSIPLAADDSQCKVISSSVALDPTNWDQGVSVYVAAIDDEVADGTQSCLILTGLSTSTDGRFHLVDPPDVSVAVDDDDHAGVVVAPTILEISEPNGSAAFTISLTSRPIAPVFIELTTSNAECHVIPSLITLDNNNYRIGRGVVVSAVDDTIVDGVQSCIVQTAPAISEDGAYNGRDEPDVAVTVLDDDSPFRIYLPVAVRMEPRPLDAPTLASISNPESDGAYALNWSAVPQATDYVLEEATDDVFGSATQVYSGPEVTYPITERGAARYYYRVAAHHPQVQSDWSNVEWVDVLWEREPNDAPLSEANGPLVSGLTYRGTFPTASDVHDYYFIDLAATHSVELWLTNIASGQNYDLVLRNGQLDPLGYSGELGNQNEHISAATVPEGRYYVQVYHRSTGGSTIPYQLVVEYE